MYLGLLNPLLKCDNKELDVLAALIKVYYGNKKFPVEVVNKLINTDKVRRAVQELLGMKSTYYNYLLFKMRKKRILNKDGTVPEGLLKIYPKDGAGELKFTLKIKDHAV